MKVDSGEKHIKRIIFSVLIPTLLVAGLVFCAWMYRAEMLAQTEAHKQSLLYNPGTEYIDFFTSVENMRFKLLENYASKISVTSDDELDSTLGAIRASAAEIGFSYVALVGTDAVLSTENNKKVDISGYELWSSIGDGRPALQDTGLGDGLRFAFAVPLIRDGENRGALIGFCTAKEMSGMLASQKVAGSSAAAVFEPSGTVVADSGDDGTLVGISNIYSYVDKLADGSDALRAEAGEFADNIKAGKKGSIGPVGDDGSYYAYQPLGSGGWYIMNVIDEDYLEKKVPVSSLADDVLIDAVVLIAVLLFALLAVVARERLIEKRSERRKYIEVCTIDPLTELYNKPGFEAEMRHTLSEFPDERVCAVISFEVVSFRTYNELYGYEAGDSLLKVIAGIVKANEKEDDVAGRLYSDHFVWFITGAGNEEIFETVRQSIRMSKKTELPFFLCAGIYIIDDREQQISEMIDKASIAKDTIKFKYSTGIALFDNSMLECQVEDADMVSSMMKGLKNGEFVEYYQPKYDAHTETIVGAEALARWRKPDGEIVMPNRFIDLFERNGFICKLDFYIFDRVCEFLSEELAKGKTVLPVSANFSRVHMHDTNFCRRLMTTVNKYGVDPKYIEIELTESAFITDRLDQSRVVENLHRLGFSVAIDDFGSGFSSLNMLKDFNVDTLKIDTKFLEGFERGGKVGTVVTSVIRMSKWLGIPVVAEGVQTSEQADFLRSLGCEMIQGFYYSNAVPREEYEKLVEKINADCNRTEQMASVTLDSINAVLGGNSLVNSLLDGILGGFGIYSLSENGLEVIRVNQMYYDMMGYPDVASFSLHSLNILTQVYPADVDRMLRLCSLASASGIVQKLTARRYVHDGSLMQFDVLIKRIGGRDDKPLLCMTFVNAAERLAAEREKELKKYSGALYAVFDEVFEFNYSTNTFRALGRDHMKLDEETRNLRAAEENWVNNIIYPDDRGKIEHYIALARAEKIDLPFSLDFRVLKDGEVRWITASLVSIPGSYLLCVLDVTGKKKLEELSRSMKTPEIVKPMIAGRTLSTQAWDLVYRALLTVESILRKTII